MSSGAAWSLLGLALAAILGLIAFLILRRRRNRDDDVFVEEETVYQEEPAAVAAPAVVAAAPLVPEAMTVVDDAAARPWIDIGLRPIRAEADGDVAVELTLSNSGDAQANDVRVSTWMLDGSRSSDNEQGLIQSREDAQVSTLDVAPGDNRALEAVLPIPATAGTPVLVAEARYPLADGREGRIAAAFEIDVNGGDVEARLHEVIERA